MKLGILGAGRIAETMAATVKELTEVTAYAVASRELERAQSFAEKFHFEKAYGSYEELVNDPEVDFIYIATPHSHHFEHAKLCMDHGKHVLCEKAFTMNEKQAAELFSLAKEKNVLITEAIWTRYMPSRHIINNLLSRGTIGEVYSLNANLCYPITYKERIMRPELAGGALLDLGIYTLNFALMHLGNDYQSIASTVLMTKTGVDAQECITLTYADGKMAVLTSSIYNASDRQGIFYGSKGYLVVDNINNPLKITIFDTNHQLVQEIDLPEQITGYEYEVLELIDCIKNGKTECPSMPHSETLRIMHMMDGLRNDWGLRYPQEVC